jgi:hypothetical protein
MPVTEATVLHIVCDNPACPGNTLDPADRTGWLFVHTEIYGEGPTTEHVYCTTTCASADHESFDVRSPQPPDTTQPLVAAVPDEATT